MPKKKLRSQTKISQDYQWRLNALNLMGRMYADFNARYYGTNKSLSDFTDEDFLYDGLIRTSVGFYRLFEDTQNGNRVLLYAQQAEDLIPQHDQETGEYRLAPNDKITIIHEALAGGPDGGPTRGTIMREAMIRHYRELLDAIFNHLNLYSSDVTDQFFTASDPKRRRVIKFSNGEAAYAMVEDKSGEVSLWLYIDRENRQTQQITSFTKLDKKSLPKSMFNIFSRGQKLGKFKNFDEAYDHLTQDWAARSSRIWDGISPLTIKDKAKDIPKALLRTMRKIGCDIGRLKWHRAFLTAAVVAASFALVPAARLWQVITAVVLASAQAMRDMLIEEGILQAWSLTDRKKAPLSDAYSFASRRALAQDYMLQDTGIFFRTNIQNRWTPAINPEKLSDLRPVSQRDGGMLHDDAEPWGYETISDRDHWLATAQNRFIGGIIAPFNQNTLSALTPNGMIGLFHLDDQNGETVSYLALRPDMVRGHEMDIPPEAADLLAKGIVRVRHVLGQKTPEVEPLSYTQFTQEVREMVVESTKSSTDHTVGENIEQILAHIHCLFNEAQGINKQKPVQLSEDFLALHPEHETAEGTFEFPYWASSLQEMHADAA